MVTLVLADDHAIARQCVAGRLRAEPGFSLLAETADGIEALRLVEGLAPDVLVVSAALPGLSGLELTRRVRERRLETRVVLAAAPALESYMLEALRYGASGYVVRTAVTEDLFRAVSETAKGRRYLSPSLASRAAEVYARRAAVLPRDPDARITEREREVLQLAAEGLTSARIAARLGISRRTAEAHRGSVMRKLSFASQTDLILYALRRGILPPEIAAPSARTRRKRARSR